jgi:hypothetical protein
MYIVYIKERERGSGWLNDNDKIWFDSNIRREIRKRDRFRRKYLKLKTAL